MTTSPITPIPRDRFGRPLVVPPAARSPSPYTRCTTYVDALEDKFGLQKWMMRMTAVGLSQRQDLLLAVAANRDDKERARQALRGRQGGGRRPGRGQHRVRAAQAHRDHRPRPRPRCRARRVRRRPGRLHHRDRGPRPWCRSSSSASSTSSGSAAPRTGSSTTRVAATSPTSRPARSSTARSRSRMQLAVYARSRPYDPSDRGARHATTPTSSAASSSTCPPAPAPAPCTGSTSRPGGTPCRSPSRCGRSGSCGSPT